MLILCVDEREETLARAVSLCGALRQRPLVRCAHGADEALACLAASPVDAVLLAIGTPPRAAFSLAREIDARAPQTPVIFLADDGRHAVEAFRLHVAGYLVRPVDPRRLQEEVDHVCGAARAVTVKTFGEFDVFVDGRPVRFARSRAKELLAYLVDRQGGGVTRAAVHAALWENGLYDRAMQKQLDVVIRSLRATLRAYGIEDIVEVAGGTLRVVPDKISCDMYRFFGGDRDAIGAYRGEYMSSYSWASFTEAYLDSKNNKP